jgi:hypothetical protein
MSEDLVYRLRKRAEIRRQIPGRKSVENNEPDRIADLLDEAASEIELLQSQVPYIKDIDYWEGDATLAVGGVSLYFQLEYITESGKIGGVHPTPTIKYAAEWIQKDTRQWIDKALKLNEIIK